MTNLEMKIVQLMEEKSGYQPRPVPPPSVGRALSVLVAVCAVLWVWNTDWWPRHDAPNYRLVAGILYSYWACALLLLGSNYAVFRYAMRPLWRSPRPDKAQELKRRAVLLLCILFHLAWGLLLGFIGFLLLVFSGDEAGFGGF